MNLWKRKTQSTEWMVAYISGNRSRNSTLYRVVFTILYSHRRALKMCSGVRISAPRCLLLVSAKLCQRCVKYQRNFRHRLGERRSLTFMSSGKVYISLSVREHRFTRLWTRPHLPTGRLNNRTSAHPDFCCIHMYVCCQTAGVRVAQLLSSSSENLWQLVELSLFVSHVDLNWKRRESKESKNDKKLLIQSIK